MILGNQHLKDTVWPSCQPAAVKRKNKENFVLFCWKVVSLRHRDKYKKYHVIIVVTVDVLVYHGDIFLASVMGIFLDAVSSSTADCY